MNGFEAKVIEDSINTAGVRLTTLQLRYPRFFHSEFMTHRVFSRNASSSRAIPVAKMIEQVRNEPAMPIHWGHNQPGMQANEQLVGRVLEEAQDAWTRAAYLASNIAEEMVAVNVHKQVANRILEPFQFISVVVTATEWDNFFQLRNHADAQPEIKYLAQLMQEALDISVPVLRYRNKDGYLDEEEWHLPYVTFEERQINSDFPVALAMISSARCARVSYLTHEGKEPNVQKDMKLYERLVGSVPIHASPTEHPCRVAKLKNNSKWYKNFRGWKQHRIDVEASLVA